MAVTALAVVAMLALAGCDDWIMGGMPGTGAPEAAYFETPRSHHQTTSITVRAATPLRAAAAGAHADVDSITVTVAGEDAEGVHQDPLDETALERSGSGWSGTLTGLTLGAALTFTAEARSTGDVLLFAGSTTVSLAADTETVVIGLSSVGADADRIPTVTGITVTEAEPGATASVQVSVSGSGGEQLDFAFSGGSFTPAADTVTLAAGAGTITSTYTAPAHPGSYPAQVRVTNARGNGVEVDFAIAVREAAPQHSGALTLNANLGPVVTSLAGRRTPAGVRWTAEVSTPDDGGVTFAWSFNDADGDYVDPAANPAILTGYTQATTGTLRVTVTDAAGLSASATLEIAAGMFPDALVAPAAELVINEIDYDTGSSDEFIEVYNPGGSDVDLTGYRFDLVNGTNGTAYASYAGVGQVAGGGYFVIAKQTVFDAASVPKLLLDENLQNGPDAIRIVETASGRVVDSVHYEGAVPGAGEGTPAGRDSSAAATSIGRCPNGFDSNDNGTDFGSMTATPGSANICS